MFILLSVIYIYIFNLHAILIILKSAPYRILFSFILISYTAVAFKVTDFLKNTKRQRSFCRNTQNIFSMTKVELTDLQHIYLTSKL